MSFEAINNLLSQNKGIEALAKLDTIPKSESNKYQHLYHKFRVLNFLDRYDEVLELSQNLCEDADLAQIDHNEYLSILIQNLQSLARKYKIEAGFKRIRQIKGIMNKYPDSIDTEQKFWLNHHTIQLLANTGKYQEALKLGELNLDLAFILQDSFLEAFAYNRLGYIYDFMGYLFEATRYYKSSVIRFEQRGENKYLLRATHNLAVIYKLRGLLDQSFKYFERVGDIAKNLELYPWIGQNYIDKGGYFYAKGDFDTALEFYKQALEYLELYGDDFEKFYAYAAFFEFYVDQRNKEMVKYYLDHIELLLKNNQTAFLTENLKLYRGQYLKLSNRTRERAKAMNFFEEIINTEVVDHEITNIALQNYLEMLIQELVRSEDESIYVEIKKLVKRMEDFARREEVSQILAIALLLKSKIQVIDHNFEEGKFLLNRAQKIANQSGYEYLTAQISQEYDFLINNNNNNNLFEKQSTNDLISRVKHSGLDHLIEETSQYRKHIKNPDLDIPIGILIYNSNGIKLYNHLFQSIDMVHKDLFSIVMITINSVIQEIFKTDEIISRIQHKDFTIIFDRIDDITIAYVYKGSSYAAILRMRKLIDLFNEKENLVAELLNANQSLNKIKINQIDRMVNKLFVSSKNHL